MLGRFYVAMWGFRKFNTFLQRCPWPIFITNDANVKFVLPFKYLGRSVMNGVGGVT